MKLGPKSLHVSCTSGSTSSGALRSRLRRPPLDWGEVLFFSVRLTFVDTKFASRLAGLGQPVELAAQRILVSVCRNPGFFARTGEFFVCIGLAWGGTMTTINIDVVQWSKVLNLKYYVFTMCLCYVRCYVSSGPSSQLTSYSVKEDTRLE